jgi:GMP synthase-like glutamine amidotransferase
MICYVDMEHDRAITGARRREDHRAHVADVKQRLEDISGTACAVRRYKDVSRRWLQSTEAQALVLSGNVTEWHRYDEAELRELGKIVREGSPPILGLCGGLQFIAIACGGEVGPMRKLSPGEEDVGQAFGSGYAKEWGFTPVGVTRRDPLFDGLREPVFLQAHYWEVKQAPEDFELLASTDLCSVQVLRRICTLVYGTQFHPEAYVAEPSDRDSWLIDLVYPGGYSQLQPDGRRLLANFFHMAGVLG